MERFDGPSVRVSGPPVPRFVHECGVTLLELLMVLAMIGILSAVAVAGMQGFITRKGLYQETDRLTLAIRRTRDLAMAHACPWRMIIQPGSRSWRCYGDSDSDGVRDAGEMALGPFVLDEGISFGSTARSGPNSTALPADGVSFVDDQICFSPLGSCNSGSIYLTDRGASTAVRLMPASGEVRVWQYRGAWREL
jgi:prepilin-type N-terminal cleavage/methylation domain-containing protein